MFKNLGLDGSAGLLVGIVAVCALLPMIFIHWKGASIREQRAAKALA
jgi:hypothetical protein